MNSGTLAACYDDEVRKRSRGYWRGFGPAAFRRWSTADRAEWFSAAWGVTSGG
jgi:hypothetical protein